VLLMGSFGYYMPFQRTAFHGRIPSDKRATVLSLDSLVGNGGAIVGQPILGRMSDVVGFPAGYFTGTFLTILTLPVLAAFGRSEKEERRSAPIQAEAVSTDSPVDEDRIGSDG
jgi:MFS family permease